MKRLLLFATLMGLITFGVGSAHAQNLLSQGDFEAVGGEITGWTLLESGSISGLGGVNSAERSTYGQYEGDYQLFLRSWEGGSGEDWETVDAVLSQTVAGTEGETYTFTGWSRWEDNYSGGVSTLTGGPMSGEASPTETNMRVEFLDSSGSVIGTPVELDLRTEQANIDYWLEHTLTTSAAPTGTASVRVTAEALDMVFNTDPLQSAFYDNFSLTAASNPGTELLANAGLEEDPPSGLDSWTVAIDDPQGSDEVVRLAGFANHTTGGANGLWFSSWLGETGTEVDGSVSQVVEAVEGGNYTFSGFSRFETNFSAASTFMEIAFLDAGDAVIGTPVTFDVEADRDTQSGGSPNDGAWYEHSFSAVAPSGAASVQVTGGWIDGVSTTGAQSAFFDDFVLTLSAAEDPDFDADGDVDVADLMIFQKGFGLTGQTDNSNGDANGDGTVDAADLLIWKGQFGTGSEMAALGAVPEPSSAGLLLVSALAAVGVRRRRS